MGASCKNQVLLADEALGMPFEKGRCLDSTSCPARPVEVHSNSLRCCVCTGAESQPYRTMDGFQYLRCNGCGLVFLQTTRNDNERFYEDSIQKLQTRQSKSRHAIEYWSFPQLYDKHREVFESFFAERLTRMRSAGFADGTVLDIGCGYGFFVHYLSKQGISAQGIDTAEEQISWGRQHLDIDITASSIEEFPAGQHFSAVVMMDVLEHVWDPGTVLRHVHNLLLPGGVLAVQVPNLLGIKFPPGHSWGVPHHIWQFSKGTLVRLLQNSGFQVVGSDTGVLGIIGMHERGGPSFIERTYMWLGKKMQLGNRLLLICRKTG